MDKQNRKPRIALMGEFSAGKSTLSNLLLGARPLPEKVTATRLSPVWMSHGTDAPYRVDMEGHEEPIRLEELGAISVEETRVIRMFFEADILGVCDLIDFPGISDPNMSSDVWMRLLDEVDAVVWCTHATQAWRQSEAAVWETIPAAVREHSCLLITRFDKLTTERDKSRVIARINNETQGLFAKIFPISLTEALAAGDDDGAFEAAGGFAFLQFFLSMIENLQAEIGNTSQTLYSASQVDASPAPDTVTEDEHHTVSIERSATAEKIETPVVEPDAKPVDVQSPPPEEDAPTRPFITPRRVRPNANTQRPERPRRRVEDIKMTETRQPDVPESPAPRQDGLSDLRETFKKDVIIGT